jgi:hypothetical protein
MAIVVSKPAPQVLASTVPEQGAVKRYQTSLPMVVPDALQPAGRAGSESVAPTVEKATLPAPIAVAPLQLSLAGAGADTE